VLPLEPRRQGRSTSDSQSAEPDLGTADPTRLA
jgi:hypothetical protein